MNHNRELDSIFAPEQRSSEARDVITTYEPATEMPMPIPISQLGAGDSVTWLWHVYLAKGYTTLFSGVWKGGKSTLLAYLLKAMGEGGELAGSVEPGRALVISEEGKGLWSHRRDELGIGDHAEFICRPFTGRPRYGEWIEFVAHLAQLTTEREYGLLVIDTIAGVLPVVDENDAAKMLSALMPLNRITEAGAAILLIHHPRKGDGGEGMASRGSGALPGFVDTILELRRFAPAEREDRRRTLTAYSRFDETPAEQVIELTDSGYRLVGTKADASRSDRMDAVAELLPSNGPGLTVAELRTAWPENSVPKPGIRMLRGVLTEGARLSRWLETGAGTRNDPHRYRAYDDIPAPIESDRAGIELNGPDSLESRVNDIPARSLSKGPESNRDDRIRRFV